MARSIRAGHPVTLDTAVSIADGLLTLRPGDLTFAHVRALVDDVVSIDDEAIARAVRWLFTEAKLVAEPSGAAAVAAALRADDGANVVAVVSGGNVDAQDFAEYVR
jgi:threonine dehydratase